MIELTYDDILAAIDYYLESRGASHDIGTLEFRVGTDGLLTAELGGDLAEEEDEKGWPEAAILAPDLLHELEQVARATAQRDTVDVFTGEPVRKGSPCLWIAGKGVTAVHPSRWPHGYADEFEMTESRLETIGRHLGVSSARTEQVLSHDEMLELCDRLGALGMHAAVAVARRASKDSFSGAEIVDGEELLWIEGVGFTRAPLEHWPEGLRKKLGEKESGSEAQTAADVLGGGGEVLGRGDALAKGVKKS